MKKPTKKLEEIAEHLTCFQYVLRDPKGVDIGDASCEWMEECVTSAAHGGVPVGIESS